MTEAEYPPAVLAEDRYRLIALRARGGMAEVWEAEDRVRGERVALKRILPELASDPSLSQLFLDEASIASRLEHPAIVRLLDVGTLEGRAFHALELIDGVDAGTLIEGAPLPVELALYIAAEVASGLGYAHALADEAGAPLGIVHRDVSPSNVLLSRAGRVCLGDFGIAAGAHRRERTQTGHTKGKAAYMSPEQTLGARVDARADVFGLGCTLHALVRGQSPLADPDAMAGLLAQEAVRLDPALPADLAAIVQRAIAPRAAARYPTMAAMESALREALGARGMADPRVHLAARIASASVANVKSEVTQETVAQRPAPAAREVPTRWALPAILGTMPIAFGLIAFGLIAFGAIAWRSPASAVPEPVPSTPLVPGPDPPPAPRPDPPPAPLVEEGPAPIALETGPETPREAAPRAEVRARPTARETPESDPLRAPDPPPPEPIAPEPIGASASVGVVNFRLPRESRVTLDGGRTAFRDAQRGHPCDTTGLCHLPEGRHALVVALPDGTRETATLCVSEGATVRAFSPLASTLGCD